MTIVDDVCDAHGDSDIVLVLVVANPSRGCNHQCFQMKDNDIIICVVVVRHWDNCNDPDDNVVIVVLGFSVVLVLVVLIKILLWIVL